MKRKKDAEVKPEKKKVKEWRFYRSNLCTFVWDPDNDTIMANFSKGHFTTKNKKVANVLRGKGYIEIDLNATQPPNIIVSQPAHALKEGQNVPIMGNGINEALGQHKMEVVTEVVTEEVKAPETVE